MMINSGARGNIEQMRQMAGMRGLMADPSGRIIDLPIKSNFKEGLSVLEYFISTHGARKGRADTALRTADSGYLTRRMVDVAQNVIIYQEDCGTDDSLQVLVKRDGGSKEQFMEKVEGRIAGKVIADKESGEVLVNRNEEISEKDAERIYQSSIPDVWVRSVLHCRSHFGLCQKCYGRDLGRGQTVQVGEPVGIVAAQAIGEPGTQLTMRTFHAGGVAGGLDITQGLPRVEELFEARTPKGEAPITEISGIVEIKNDGNLRRIEVTAMDFEQEEYDIEGEMEVVVQDKAQVKAKDVLARKGTRKLFARLNGIAKVTKKKILVVAEEKEKCIYTVARNSRLKVDHGQLVSKGQQLIEGSINLKQLLEVSGVESTQNYLVEEVQKIYRSQGVSTNDKHIEIIVRRMLSRVKVIEAGDSEFLPGDLINRFKYEKIRHDVIAKNGRPPYAKPVILGITKAALNSGSFLSAASFQETIRVLTKAALYGLEDRLVGLKENLIIGKLIPAGLYARRSLEVKTAAL
jgi:DNA-directed RNA polymerase subunit beta'